MGDPPPGQGHRPPRTSARLGCKREGDAAYQRACPLLFLGRSHTWEKKR